MSLSATEITQGAVAIRENGGVLNTGEFYFPLNNIHEKISPI